MSILLLKINDTDAYYFSTELNSYLQFWSSVFCEGLEQKRHWKKKQACLSLSSFLFFFILWLVRIVLCHFSYSPNAEKRKVNLSDILLF